MVTFLRLLVDDARGRASETVGLGLERAREEMVRLERRGLRDLLEDLLAHHFHATLEVDSFVGSPEVGRGLQSAWSELERRRGEGLDLPGVPAPGEEPEAVMVRLLEGLERCGAPAERIGLWSARERRCRGGPVEGERALLERWEAREEEPRSRSLEVAVVQGVAECRLDRGAVRAARDGLDRHLGLVSRVPRLRRLLAWTHLLAGDRAAADEIAHGLESPRAAPGERLPAGLVELREQIPEWAPLLRGDAREGRAPHLSESAAGERGEIGAVFLGVFIREAEGGVRPLHLDLSPGLSPALEAWLRRRDGADSTAGEPERRLLVERRPVRDHRVETPRLRGALGESTSLALLLWPIEGASGEVAGWIHIECEHHLLPARVRLEAMARIWKRRIELEAGRVPARESAHRFSSMPRASSVPRPIDAPPLPAEDPRAREALALLADLGTKLALRRWWLFDLAEGELILAAEGGGALEDWRRDRGGGGAARRALATGEAIGFGEADAELSMHGRSASGVVVPIATRGRVRGLLLFESSRRADFAERDVGRLERAAAVFAPRWTAARFRSWHLDRFGHEVLVDPEGLGLGRLLRDVAVTGSVRSPVALVGPEGAGKEILARWIHFETFGRRGGCDLFACGLEVSGGLESSIRGREGPSLIGQLRRGEEGTLILDELDTLPPGLQIRLRDHLAPSSRRHRREGGLRPVAILREGLDRAVASGRLRGDLASCFQRLEHRVPSLRERRDEIPALARLLARRFAEEESLAAPGFDERALALLWRQRWEGNVRELEGLIYKVVAFHPGEVVSGEQVGSLARRFHLDLVERLPSRRPHAADIQSALRITRHASGSLNKTRAALYLGWDPDTLVSRLRDLKLGEERPARG
jgi:putative methionine-R-sulfoxide reductase with GAF domain